MICRKNGQPRNGQILRKVQPSKNESERNLKIGTDQSEVLKFKQ